jgi:hypothetical protein
MLESKGESNSKSCLDVQTMKFGVLLSLDHINLCTCTRIARVYYRTRQRNRRKKEVLEAHELADWSMDLESRCEWRPPEIL